MRRVKLRGDPEILALFSILLVLDVFWAPNILQQCLGIEHETLDDDIRGRFSSLSVRKS